MAFQWEYPVFSVPFGGGYASVVDQGPEQQTHMLAIFTQKRLAEQFMTICGIPGDPRSLDNAREFSWLLQNLRNPVTHVAFDPVPESKDVEARWTVSVQTLLQDHLVVDFSPWNYPIYAVAQETGYTSITGPAGDAAQITAVALFTRAEKAESYLRSAQQTGTLQELGDLDQTRTFLQQLSPDVSAVALDPVVEEGQHTAKYCFALETILAKYLVRKQGSGPTCSGPTL